MAAPADATIKNLNGSWTMDYTLSDPTDPLLTLQGMSWFLRKAISLAYVTVEIKQYPDETDNKIMHIDIKQFVTGGIEGTTENRTTDKVKREHQDHIFGRVEGTSELFRGSKGADGKVRPNFEFSTPGDNEKAKKFLNGEILKDDSECDGFVVEDLGEELGQGEGLWLQSYVVSLDSAWTAEQIWGFEVINGERYYTRRIAVQNNGAYEFGRFVYSFVPPQPQPTEEDDLAY
ncbi:hypothetical protein FE257_002976 [Aspergillus nanangensis]|uniref:Uncharacterized protein n=1 Tax=Aspergillus nanangensis TaxID=2582783 RepID=A0AAD4CT49_ASPNN|nr:hypothetical protein FE257_002976 [Aspergillus nanangensis]